MTTFVPAIDLMKQTQYMTVVQSFIEDSEVTYESLNTNESEAKTEAAPTADSNAKRSYVNFTIYSDVDEDVFKKGNQTPKTKK